MMLPLQNNVTKVGQATSGPGRLTPDENQDQFSEVLETIDAPGGRAVKAAFLHLDKTESVGNPNKAVIPSGLLYEESSVLLMNKQNDQSLPNNLDANSDPQLIGAPIRSDEVNDRKSEDSELLEDVISGTLNPEANLIIYSDQTAVMYKTDTFEGTVILRASATPTMRGAEDGLPLDSEKNGGNTSLSVARIVDQGFIQRDAQEDSLLIMGEKESNIAGAESQQIAELLTSNPTSTTRGVELKQREDNVKSFNLSLNNISARRIELNEVLPTEQEGTYTESDASNYEELSEPLEALAEDGSVIDLSSVPNPNLMRSDLSTHLEKTIRISETGAIHQMYEAIADAHEALKPNESKTLTITLTPEELGAVHVELQSDDMGNIRAVLSLEKPETLKLFQQDVEQLKIVLKEIGIEESNVTLTLLADSNHEHRHQSEYTGWDERESLLARNPENKETLAETQVYGPERKNSKHLDIRA